MSEEQNIIPEDLDDNACSVTQWEAMKQEVLSVIDEKFDVEAVAQMVEQLDFSKKLNSSLQQTFQKLQRELSQKDQVIQHLQGRLDNLELDIALLKRTVVAPYPFTPPSITRPHVTPRVNFPQENVAEPKQETSSFQFDQGDANVRPPDFSKLRAMTVAEPTNKFVPPSEPKQEFEETVVS